MSMSVVMMREHLYGLIRERLDDNEARRGEALAEYLTISGAAPDKDAAAALAAMIPPVMPRLYEKWINMFLDRLFETIPGPQLELLCDGSEDNNAAAVLAYIMFLESARMEKQIDEDLAAYGLALSGEQDKGAAAAGYIRTRLASLARKMNKEE